MSGVGLKGRVGRALDASSGVGKAMPCAAHALRNTGRRRDVLRSACAQACCPVGGWFRICRTIETCLARRAVKIGRAVRKDFRMDLGDILPWLAQAHSEERADGRIGAGADYSEWLGCAFGVQGASGMHRGGRLVLLGEGARHVPAAVRVPFRHLHRCSCWEFEFSEVDQAGLAWHTIALLLP